jgi:hypothetical protein
MFAVHTHTEISNEFISLKKVKSNKNIIGIVLDESLTMENCVMNIERDLE